MLLTDRANPAYRCLAYRQSAPVWAMLDDLFQGAEAWLGRDELGRIHINPKAQIYLPREAAENDDDYLNRLSRSPFDDRFAQAIRKFVALVLANGIQQVNIPPAIAAHFNNLDNQGGSLHRVVTELAIAALRHGHTFLLVDYPPKPKPDKQQIRSQLDFNRSGRRPYWVPYRATDVIHWIPATIAGVTVLRLVTLQETAIAPQGDFGETLVTRYRVLRPGSWELWQERIDRGEPQYDLIDGGETSLNYIPLTCLYGGLREGFFKSRCSLKSLADLNLNHYQVKSDHLRKLHLCCLPVPELRDSMRPDNEPLVIGPNVFVHIRDSQGSFNWREPLASSIEQSRKEVHDLEDAMDVLSAAYLQNPGDRQAALTTAVQAVELESTLQQFADQFCDGLNEALRFHGDMMGIIEPGQLRLSGDIVRDKGRDSQMLLAYSAMGDRGQIDQRALLALLKQQEYLPEDFDIEAQPGKLSSDGVLLRELVQLPQLDMVSKRQTLELLKAHQFLPTTFDIDAAIAATGDEIRIAAAGYLKTQPAPNDEFIAPSHVQPAGA